MKMMKRFLSLMILTQMTENEVVVQDNSTSTPVLDMKTSEPNGSSSLINLGPTSIRAPVRLSPVIMSGCNRSGVGANRRIAKPPFHVSST